MSIIIGKGNHIKNCKIGEQSVVIGSNVLINGVEIPPCPVNSNNYTIINGKVFVGGYEWKNGRWKKTLRALYHKLF